MDDHRITKLVEQLTAAREQFEAAAARLDAAVARIEKLFEESPLLKLLSAQVELTNDAGFPSRTSS